MGFKINIWTILLMIASLAAGFFLNIYSNNITNKKLLDALKAELATINEKKAQAGPAESALLVKRKSEVEAQINLLQNKQNVKRQIRNA